MSQRDFSEVEAEGTPELPPASRSAFVELVRQSNAACQSGDFATAVALYTDALQLDPTNHILYSNRSAARVKQGQFAQALQDAARARELCPSWPKAHYRQGVALQCLGRHGDALAAFAAGLAQEPASQQLLAGLVEAAVKSPLRAALEPTFRQLEAMKLDRSAFVVISVVGQELLAAGLYSAAVQVLESALRIGSCSLKLRGSVLSALSSAHWALNQLDEAIGYMQQDLAVAKSLGDTAGECRAHGNLGSAYFSQGSYREALTAHRYQLVLAMKCRDTQAAAAALTSLGHVYAAVGDYANALASHKQCVQLVKQMGDRLQEAREIGNVGAVYLAMGDFDSAVDCHTQHLRLARRLGDRVEEARAYSNLGSSHHYRRNFAQAQLYHENVLRLAQATGDRAVEARAYAGLGHAARCAGDAHAAKRWHERQLDVALAARDRVGEGRACSNLGIVYQLLGEHDAALKLHRAHLGIARVLGDRAGMGRAYGNIGNAYSAAGFYDSAVKYHKQELTISKEVRDRSSEASTHGNLAVAYQALGAHDTALTHYKSHLGIARELKDAAGEACALLNLGNCLSSRGHFADAVPYYEQYLMLSQELADVDGEAKACHLLGYAHYCIGNYREAVRYYDQDLALAKDLRDNRNVARAYCNLGLAHLALAQLEAALECQRCFLAVSHAAAHAPGKFRALGNIGDVLVKMGRVEEAVKMYQRQLQLARGSRDRAMEAAACGALGLAHRLLRRYDKALGHHTQELTLGQETGDAAGECRAHGHLGAVHMALGNYTHAANCYGEQLERAQELHDCALEAQAHGNLGIARLNVGRYEDAIGCFEQQLATLERLPSAQLERGRAFGSLGDCYAALGDPDEACKCHERHLAAALRLASPRDQERAYRGLGRAHAALGNLQQALVCLEKRLVVAHELGAADAKAAAYAELGRLHAQLGNLEQAASCLEHQQALARELGDLAAEADGASALGRVRQQMGEHARALRHHQRDLDIARELRDARMQARAAGDLGAAHEALGDYEQAVRFHEQHLQLAAASDDRLAEALACGALGRVHQLLGDGRQAVAYLTRGLTVAEALGRRDEEAKIRHRLGLALWQHGDLEAARDQLDATTHLLEAMRRDTPTSRDYDLGLFDLHTSSYQVLQRVLVGLDKHDEALVVAERGRTRAFVDLLVERQGHSEGGRSKNRGSSNDGSSMTIERLLETVNRQRASVLYYSVAAGFLHSWLVVPTKGIVKFHEAALVDSINTDERDPTEPVPSGSGMLERLVAAVRDSLGAELAPGAVPSEDGWSTQEEPLPEKAGFLRMVSRNHLLNSSNYSLSSLFSVGSVGGSAASLQGSTRSTVRRQPQWHGPQCVRALYELLIEPFEEWLGPRSGEPRAPRQELVLVVEGDLYLVPFAVLRSSDDGADYLCERFSLFTVPSLASVRAQRPRRPKDEQNVAALVVGNPKLPATVSEHWGWNDIPQAGHEASMVAELLQTDALTGAAATKRAVLQRIRDAECVHLATHVSWKLSSVVLGPVDVLEHVTSDDDGAGSEVSTTVESPPPSEFLLSAADLLSVRLSARLVVISSSHTKDAHGWASADGLVALVRALLAAGAQAVLVSLWPAPDTATKILLRAFYSALLQGTRAARALADAMQTVQHTKHFAHPANWAGFVLVGASARLNDKVALMGQALRELLRSPDACRDALRVSLHLVEKSLQRIHRGHKNAMYTTQKSIENKAGAAIGWRELLMSVGFRFEPAADGVPGSVFFPQHDPDERLARCSASLQALLGLSAASLHALAKLTASPDAADDVISVVRAVQARFDDSADVAVAVRLWRVPGCHELLASLGLDLTDVGQDEVSLRTGKSANKRSVQFVLQALLALFDTHEAPNTLGVDSSSSMESLASASDDEPPPRPAIFPLARPALGSGAFASYARRRGEPDGRTASATDGIPPMRKRPGGGGESDAAFTPSPPVVPDVALSLAHQTRIRSLYSARRPDSSSSASSATDWDGGHATVLRRQPPPPTHPLLSSMFDNSSDSDIDAKLFAAAHDHRRFGKPGRKQDAPAAVAAATTSAEALDDLAESVVPAERPVDDPPQPASSSSSTIGIRDAILATQLRHIDREMTPTISEVYRERSIGLGLAPPLSKLLLGPANVSATASHQQQPSPPQPDDSLLDDIKNALAILDAGADTSSELCAKCRSCACSCRRTEPWLATEPAAPLHGSDLSTADILDREFKKREAPTVPVAKDESARLSPFSEMSRRDEGDGRSVADSQCSSSYGKRPNAGATFRPTSLAGLPEKVVRTRPGVSQPQQRTRNIQP